MKIIVNDANVLIDLVELGILHHFFALPFEFHTTNLVFGELLTSQQEALQPFIDANQLIIATFTTDQLVKIISIRDRKPGLSEQDCSAFFHAQTEDAALITSDNSLRKFAASLRLEVHGHLWILDNLVAEHILSGPEASTTLTRLCDEINPKLGLPRAECQRRHTDWLSL